MHFYLQIYMLNVPELDYENAKFKVQI